MIYVPDTHALVWYVTADKRLGKRARAAFASVDEGANDAVISVLLLAEIMYLEERRRVQIRLNELLARLQSNVNYVIAPLDLEVVLTAQKIENVPELFDRMILATALKYHAAFLTRDSVFDHVKSLEIVW